MDGVFVISSAIAFVAGTDNYVNMNQACRPPTEGESGLLRADLSKGITESNGRWNFFDLFRNVVYIKIIYIS